MGTSNEKDEKDRSLATAAAIFPIGIVVAFALFMAFGLPGCSGGCELSASKQPTEEVNETAVEETPPAQARQQLADEDIPAPWPANIPSEADDAPVKCDPPKTYPFVMQVEVSYDENDDKYYVVRALDPVTKEFHEKTFDGGDVRVYVDVPKGSAMHAEEELNEECDLVWIHVHIRDLTDLERPK